MVTKDIGTYKFMSIVITIRNDTSNIDRKFILAQNFHVRNVFNHKTCQDKTVSNYRRAKGAISVHTQYYLNMISRLLTLLRSQLNNITLYIASIKPKSFISFGNKFRNIVYNASFKKAQHQVVKVNLLQNQFTHRADLLECRQRNNGLTNRNAEIV